MSTPSAFTGKVSVRRHGSGRRFCPPASLLSILCHRTLVCFLSDQPPTLFREARAVRHLQLCPRTIDIRRKLIPFSRRYAIAKTARSKLSRFLQSLLRYQPKLFPSQARSRLSRIKAIAGQCTAASVRSVAPRLSRGSQKCFCAASGQQFDGFEVWDGTRFVYRSDASATSAGSEHPSA
jgi:hypothetical protein